MRTHTNAYAHSNTHLNAFQNTNACSVASHLNDCHPTITTNGVGPSFVRAGAEAISLGQSYSMMMKTDGSVWAAGRGDGQLGTGDYRSRSEFVNVVPSGQCGVIV